MLITSYLMEQGLVVELSFHVLHGISGKSGTQSTYKREHDSTLSIGEHAVAFWEEKGFQ